MGDGGALKRVGVDDEVDQTELLRAVRLELLPGQHHVERRRRADQLGQPLRAAAAGQQANHHLGQAEDGLGVGGGDAVGARQRDLQPAAEARPVDRRNPRLGALHLLEPVHALLPLARDGLDLARRGAAEALNHLDVGARDERPRLRRDEHRRADRRVVLDLCGDLGELGDELLGEHVLLLAEHVHPHERDALLLHLHLHVLRAR